jgi:alanyl-tRNA synthetase
MTTRLYYTDSMLRQFDTTVRACDARDGRVEAVLDRTAFYPTSGGQPFDTGTLGPARVLEVVDRDDGEIAHVVSEPLEPGASVTGAIDWARRFDHMQQHTGQHILSAAFDRLFQAATVSFHLGAETSTIDLAREVSAHEIASAEDAANEVIWADRPIAVRFASAEEAARLPLRKEPARTGELRLVEVPDFDLSACGGTHVPRTGMIGAIAASGSERFKGGTRLTFVCGRRVLVSHRRLRDAAGAVARLLSASMADAVPAIERLQSDLKTSEKAVLRLGQEISTHQAAVLRAAAETIHGVRVVLTVQQGADAAALKRLASEIVQAEGFVAILAGEGAPLPVVAARSADVRAFDAGAWLKHAIGALGGRGGGRPELAQGGVAAPVEQVMAFARESLPGTMAGQL